MIHQSVLSVSWLNVGGSGLLLVGGRGLPQALPNFPYTPVLPSIVQVKYSWVWLETSIKSVLFFSPDGLLFVLTKVIALLNRRNVVEDELAPRQERRWWNLASVSGTICRCIRHGAVDMHQMQSLLMLSQHLCVCVGHFQELQKIFHPTFFYAPFMRMTCEV